MRFNSNYSIVDVADEYMAVPIGEEANSFYGMILISEALAYLLKKMDTHKTIDELLELLLEEYDVQEDVAKEDLKSIIPKLISYRLIIE